MSNRNVHDVLFLLKKHVKECSQQYFHNSTKVEVTQMFIKRTEVIYLYNEILYNNINKQYAKKKDELHKTNVESKKPDTKNIYCMFHKAQK